MSSKILVVDDATEDLELVKAMLVANGFTVFTARHGGEGLVKARTHLPDLIISDVLMPEMDGFALFKELRKDPATAKIPVLILTVRGRMRDTFEVFGVESFLPKPFQADSLFSEISKFVTPGAVPAVDQAKPKEEKPAAAPAPRPAAAASKLDPALAAAKRKALIFGSDDSILESMVKLLEKEKCHAVITKDESQLPVQVDSMELDIILLQLNSHSATPIDKIVALLNDIIQKKQPRGKSPSVNRQTNIIIYKVEEERSGFDSSIADTESILDRCTEEGCKKYIGPFSPHGFITKIKEFIA